jgi:hypothetical protein
MFAVFVQVAAAFVVALFNLMIVADALLIISIPLLVIN